MHRQHRTELLLSLAFVTIGFIVCVAQPASEGGDTSSGSSSRCSHHHCLQGQPYVSTNLNSTKDGGQILCYCDDQCAFYKDCCSDYEPAAMQVKNTLLVTPSCVGYNISNSSRSFYNFNGVKLIPGYQLITMCPSSWYDDFSRTRCEIQDLLDPIAKTPVTGARNISYKNVYCAICNYEPLSDVLFWTFDPTKCDLPEFFADFVMYNQWDAAMRHINNSCSGELFTLPRGVHLRHCIQNQISHCPNKYPDVNVAKLCRQTVALVSLENHLYKNYYCAQCHGVNNFISQSCGKFQKLPPDITQPAPLSVLFGLQPHATEMATNNEKSSATSDSHRCRVNEMFDPFAGTCRLLYCKNGFVLKQGRCVPRIQSQENCGFNHGTISAKIRVPQKPDSGRCQQSMQHQCPAVENLLQHGDFVLVVCTSADMTPEVYVEVKFKSENISLEAIEKRLIFSLHKDDNQCELQEFKVTTRCYGNWSVPASCQNQSHPVSDVTLRNYWAYVHNLSTPLYNLNETPFEMVYTFSDIKQSIEMNYTFYICNDLCAERRFEPGTFKINGTKVILLEYNIELDEFDVRWEDDSIYVCQHKLFGYIFEFDTVQVILTIIGSTLSLVALLLSFITYITFPALRNLPGKSVMSLIAALFTAQLLFLFVSTATNNQMFCTIVAVILHYVWLASFSWTSAIAFYLSRTLGTQARPRAREHRDCDKKFAQFSVFGWGAPLVILVACVIVEFCSHIPIVYGTETVCWIGDRLALMIAFFLPIAVALLVNAVLYARILIFFTFRGIASTEPSMDKLRRKRLKRDSMVSLKVAFLMGFTWIFAFMAYYTTNSTGELILWYVFIIFNSSQGVYIFLAFTCTPQVIALWKNKLDMEAKPELTSPGERHRMVTRTSSPNENGKLDQTFYTQGSPTGTPKSTGGTPKASRTAVAAKAVIDETAAISNV